MEDKDGNNLYPASFTDIVFRADGIKLEDELDRIDSKDVEQDNKLSQHERRLTEVEGKGGSSNVLLGGEEQDKFNFVKNEVVQDGLINYHKPSKNFTFNTTKDFSYNFVTNHSKDSGYLFTINQYGLFVHNDIDKGIGYTTGLKKLEEGKPIRYIPNSSWVRKELTKGKCNICLTQKDNVLSLIVNGKVLILDTFITEDTELAVNFIGVLDGGAYHTEVFGGLVYNRALSPQEIQHNFSVLNNSPSIKELHATDSTGKTSILKLGSDEDHVEMSTGRTLREEYMGVLKTMGKEFISADGSPVEVPNGIEARLINGEIKGQTVKNEFIKSDVTGGAWSSTDLKGTKLTDGVRIERIALGGVLSTSAFYNAYGSDIIAKQLKPNTKYTVAINIKSNLQNINSRVYFVKIDGTYTPMSPASVTLHNGLNLFTVTTNSTQNIDTNTLKLYVYTSTQEITCSLTSIGDYVECYAMGLYEGDLTNVIKDIGNGLSSTQAIISNNGQQYPIYATEEDKANKKVISLPFAEDKVTLNEDGSATWVDTNEKLKLDNTLDWKMFVYENGYGRCALILNNAITGKTNERILADTAHVVNWSDVSNTKVDRFISNSDGAKDLLLYIKDATTIENYKQNLETNPINIIYKATPVTSPLDKSIVPTILTHNKTNNLEAGGAVKPSSFKVTVPVDAIGELRAEINEIKKQLGAVAALQLGQIN